VTDFLDEITKASTKRDRDFPSKLAAAYARRIAPMERERLHPTIPHKRTNLPKNIQACIYYGLNDDRNAPHLAITLVLMNVDDRGVLRGTPIELVMHADPPPLGNSSTTISLRGLASWLDGGDQVETIDRHLSICASSKWTPHATIDVEWDPDHADPDLHRVHLRLNDLPDRFVQKWSDFADMSHVRWQQLLNGEVVDE
jgi:hypothetical protein